MPVLRERPPAALRAWRNAVFLVFLLLGLNFGSWLSRIPAVRDHLDATPSQVSFIVLAIALGSMAGLIVSNPVVAKLGPRRSLLVFLSAQSLALPLAVTGLWLGSLPLGLGLLFVFGFAFSTCDVAVNVTGAQSERAIGRPLLSAYHAAYSLGAVASMGIGGLMERFSIGFVPHLIGTCLVVAAAALVAVRFLPHDQPNEEFSDTATGEIQTIAEANAEVAATTPAARAPRGTSAWRDPRILMVGFVALSMSLSEGTASDWLPLAVIDGQGSSNEQGALVLGAFLAAMTVTRLLGAALLTRFGRVPVLRGSVVSAAIGMLLVIFAPTALVAGLGAVLWGAGVALGFPIGMSAAADDPKKAVPGVAAVAAIAYMAYLVGPITIGFLGEHFGLANAFLPVLAILIAGGFLAGAAREPASRSRVD